MNINNITGTYDSYKNSLSKINSKIKGTYSSKDNVGKSFKIKDTLDISTPSKNISNINSIETLNIDKGTAAHTTLYVDRSSFNQIVNYTTNNPECKWEELGIDDEKRWVVVNGQRFECPLSEEEKELRRKLRKTLIDILNESEESRKKHKPKLKLKTQYSININFDKNDKIYINIDKNLQANDKIKNLMNNDKVMIMLKDIMKMNNGQGFNLLL